MQCRSDDFLCTWPSVFVLCPSRYSRAGGHRQAAPRGPHRRRTRNRPVKGFSKRLHRRRRSCLATPRQGFGPPGVASREPSGSPRVESRAGADHRKSGRGTSATGGRRRAAPRSPRQVFGLAGSRPGSRNGHRRQAPAWTARGLGGASRRSRCPKVSDRNRTFATRSAQGPMSLPAIGERTDEPTAEGPATPSTATRPPSKSRAASVVSGTPKGVGLRRLRRPGSSVFRVLNALWASPPKGKNGSVRCAKGVEKGAFRCPNRQKGAKKACKFALKSGQNGCFLSQNRPKSGQKRVFLVHFRCIPERRKSPQRKVFSKMLHPGGRLFLVTSYPDGRLFLVTSYPKGRLFLVTSYPKGRFFRRISEGNHSFSSASSRAPSTRWV